MSLPSPVPSSYNTPPSGLMQLEQRMQQFNIAYTHAIASAAGYDIQHVVVDDDSVDLTIKSRAKHGVLKSPRVDLQLKATASPMLTGSDLKFDLPMKNYDDLRDTDVALPRYLVVMDVPSSHSDWVKCDSSQIVLLKRAYYISLHGMPTVRNSSQKRVSIPTSNVFNVESLHVIMNKAGRLIFK